MFEMMSTPKGHPEDTPALRAVWARRLAEVFLAGEGTAAAKVRELGYPSDVDRCRAWRQ